MRPVNGFIMLQKMPRVEEKNGIILPDASERDAVISTGWKVIDVAEGVVEVKKGDIVYIDPYSEGAGINGMIFCKASGIVAIK